MGIKGIDNVGVAVRDLDAVVEFFRTAVGLQVTGPEDGHPRSASITVGDRYLYVFETESASQPPKRADDLTANPPGLDHLSFTVDDVDEAFTALGGRGVRFDGQPETVAEWGMRLVRFQDPEGNGYYLVQNLGGN
jgi:methylmalonyl-CoA/ethylmalonyl-CoA epimerase